MTDPNRPLDVARADLAQRALAAEEVGHWQEAAILVQLAAVADMVCRIGDHPHSSHYRADKVGPLVEAALNLQWECFSSYLGESDNQASEELERANDVLRRAAGAVRGAMWAFAGSGRGATLDPDQARDLRGAASGFARWAEDTAGRAVAHRDDELELPDLERGELSSWSAPRGPVPRSSHEHHAPGFAAGPT